MLTYVLTLQEEKAIERGILPLLQRATLVQTFGQRNHVCLKEGSITIPPYAPPQKMQAHLIPPDVPRSIFVYFRGLFYDVGNDPEGGYYARFAFSLSCSIYLSAEMNGGFGWVKMIFLYSQKENFGEKGKSSLNGKPLF